MNNRVVSDVSAKTTNSHEKIGIAVIGAGGVSTSYLEFFAQSALTELIAVADPTDAVRQHVSRQYDLKTVGTNYTDVVQCDDIDLVCVFTPHHLHHPIVIAALQAQKHVLCEKPVAISLQEADEMIDLAEQVGRRLFVTLNMRLNPIFSRTKEILGNDDLGQISMAYGSYFGYELERLADPDHWKGHLQKAGGGVLLDGGYHMVDLMNYFLGPAKSVQALTGQFSFDNPDKGEDNVSLLVEYESGGMGVIQVSFAAPHVGCYREPTLVLEETFIGSKGTLRGLYDYDTIEVTRKLELIKPESGRQSLEVPESGLDHKAQFIDCLINNTNPVGSAIDARNALAVCVAAYQSVRSGRKEKVDWRY